MQRSWRRRLLLGGVTVFVCLIAVTLAIRSRPRPRMNAILVTLGTTRADHLGCYGYPFAQTPTLDSLAEKGAVFENAYSSVPLTLPAHATMFTSLYPPEHGLHLDGKNRLGDGVPVLAQFLKSGNYETGAFVSTFALNSKFGLNRGFDTYDDAFTDSDAAGQRRDGRSVMDAALEWLNGRRNRPFFCWIHLADAHFPYDLRPEIFGDMFSERPYDAGIAFADSQLGRLTEFLQRHRLINRTLIVVAGDHGEGLMDHDEPQHGQFLYNSTLHVPLIIAGPDFIQSGLRVTTPVSHVDVMPTILQSLEIASAKTRYRGVPLGPAAAGQRIRPRVFHIETYFPSLRPGGKKLVGLVTGGWKYIHGAQPTLYNLDTDPGETTNVAATEEKECKKFREWFRKGQHNMDLWESPLVQLSDAEQRLLSAEAANADESGKNSGNGERHQSP